MRNSVIMFARWRDCNTHLMLSVILLFRLIIHTSKVISQLKTIQAIFSWFTFTCTVCTQFVYGYLYAGWILNFRCNLC